MKRRPTPLILLLALAVLTSAAALGAPPGPVHWSVQRTPRKPVTSGRLFTITLAATIDPGWHLYSLDEIEGGPMPTVIGLAAGDPLTLLDVAEPEPHKLADPVTHAITGTFQNSVAFTLKLRAPATRLPANSTSHMLIRYQVCNDQVCLPPHTETVSVALQGIVPTQ